VIEKNLAIAAERCYDVTAPIHMDAGVRTPFRVFNFQ